MKTAIALALLLAAPALADCQGDLQRCAAIEDSLERLRCFDELASGAPAAAPDCPLNWEIEQKWFQTKKRVTLTRDSCPAHEFLTIREVMAEWGKKKVVVSLAWINDFQSDRTARVQVVFAKEDGTEIQGKTVAKNFDSGEKGKTYFSFRVPGSDIVGARFMLKVAGE